jgi:hypothetical protein
LYWTLIDDPSASAPRSGPSVPEADVPAEPPAELVDVVVRSDVSDGELLVDGDSLGTSPNGQWNLRMPARVHVIALQRNGVSLTTQLFTARHGARETVELKAPAETKASLSADQPTP